MSGLNGVKDVNSSGQQIFVSSDTQGVVRGWGGNSHGQLGDNTIIERHAPSYAYFTPVAAPVVKAPDTTSAGSVYTNPYGTYESMNDCLKALGPVAGGQICKNIIVDPKQRGNGN